MSADADKRPIIIVKKHGGHAGHHGGAWKVAYADFVTAMMAFFLVMWLVTQSSQVKENVAAYFRDPIGFSSQSGGSGILPGGPNLMNPNQQSSLATPDDSKRLQRERLQKKADEILKAFHDIPELARLAKNIEVEVTEEGLRIQLMEGEKGTFFDLGSSRMSEEGVEALATIAKLVAPIDHDVALEGHTDSKPYSGAKGYTNWELSADRANVARRVLGEHGVTNGRVRAIRGYADTRLRFPESPLDPRNRRIAIVVLSHAAGEALAKSQ